MILQGTITYISEDMTYNPNFTGEDDQILEVKLNEKDATRVQKALDVAKENEGFKIGFSLDTANPFGEQVGDARYSYIQLFVSTDGTYLEVAGKQDCAQNFEVAITLGE